MYEKISDEIIRIKKVKKLKRKILSEIDDLLSKYRNGLSENLSDRGFEFFVRRSFALLELKKYVETEYSFMSYEVKDYKNDIVVYIVSDKDLNVWLQEDYSFAISFLIQAEDVDYNVFQLLNDKYLGYNFTNYGNEFCVEIENIPRCSEVKINAICDICGSEREMSFSAYNKSCSLWPVCDFPYPALPPNVSVISLPAFFLLKNPHNKRPVPHELLLPGSCFDEYLIHSPAGSSEPSHNVFSDPVLYCFLRLLPKDLHHFLSSYRPLPRFFPVAFSAVLQSAD